MLRWHTNKNYENVFFEGCGAGFHLQFIVAESRLVGFSLTSMHYVSEKLCDIIEHVYMVGVGAEEWTKFANQAAED